MSRHEGESLHPRVGAAFYGRFHMNPAQTAALESLLAGRNLVLSAGTGSGKTEAVVVPFVSRGWLEALREDRMFVLYVCPTKALVNDVAGRLRAKLDTIGVRVAVRHGDRNDLALAAKAHLLITTPESLGILLKTREPRLAEIRAVVVDEVHLLYNTQRGLQLAVQLQRLRKVVAQPFQWAALSATVADLGHIRDFFFGMQEPADFLAFPATRKIEAHIRVLDSLEVLRSLMAKLMDAPRRKLLLFANSRRVCEEISDVLQRDPSLQRATFTHYSSLSTELREACEREFTTASRAICVATSTLEMGIDIGDIDAVVLYGAPAGVESFLQRIGRGNRRSNQMCVVCVPSIGRTALREVVIFDALVNLGRAGRLAKTEPKHLYGAIGQQCMSVIEQRNGQFVSIQDFCDEIGTLPQAGRPVIETILAELASHEYCQRHGFKNRYGATDSFWELVDKGMTLSNFPQLSSTVDLRHRGRILGSVPRYNLFRLRAGTLVRFAGRQWRVVRLEPHNIDVEPAQGRNHSVDLSFGGTGGGGLDAFLATQVWRTLFSLTPQAGDFESETWERISPALTAIRATCTVEALPMVKTSGGVRYYTFAGRRMNEVIAAWSGRTQRLVSDISVQLDSPVDLSGLPADATAALPIARGLFAPSENQTFFQQHLPLALQVEEWCEDWLKDAEVDVTLARLRSAPVIEVANGLFDFME